MSAPPSQPERAVQVCTLNGSVWAAQYAGRHICGGGLFLAYTLSELIEQRFGILEITGVEAFGEPGIDRREEVVSLLASALRLP